jgi:hypothetical protein
VPVQCPVRPLDICCLSAEATHEHGPTRLERAFVLGRQPHGLLQCTVVGTVDDLLQPRHSGRMGPVRGARCVVGGLPSRSRQAEKHGHNGSSLARCTERLNTCSRKGQAGLPIVALRACDGPTWTVPHYDSRRQLGQVMPDGQPRPLYVLCTPYRSSMEALPIGRLLPKFERTANGVKRRDQW